MISDGYFNFVYFALLVLLIIKPVAIFINNLYCDLFGTTINSSFDTGVVIGIFERLIVVALFFVGAVSAIAIIIAAKTWVRYGEIKDDNNQFRNKYLVGTLVSISLALAFCAITSLII